MIGAKGDEPTTPAVQDDDVEAPVDQSEPDHDEELERAPHDDEDEYPREPRHEDDDRR